jgi:hypothetical protein
MWMGDLETDFMKKIEDEIELDRADILFAPHHGRASGKVPAKWLEQINPKLIVIGEAPLHILELLRRLRHDYAKFSLGYYVWFGDRQGAHLRLQ